MSEYIDVKGIRWTVRPPHDSFFMWSGVLAEPAYGTDPGTPILDTVAEDEKTLHENIDEFAAVEGTKRGMPDRSKSVASRSDGAGLLVLLGLGYLAWKELA